jgi:steroid 5-alpha reductase family enzyme
MRWPPDGLDAKNLRSVAIASAATVAAAQTVTAAVALRRHRRDYADAVWGPGLGAIACVSAVVGRGDPVRRWGLAAITAGWATRLEIQMLGRVRGSDEEDPRYQEFLGDDGPTKVIGKVFVTQGITQLIVSAPIQFAAASRIGRGRRGLLTGIGMAVMVAGAVTEALADRQKSRYSELDEDEKPDVLDTGLWGWSRHPNYFGDSVVWDGAFLAACASAGGPVTLPAPILMTYVLIFATGARRTERHMQERPGYRDYQRRVSFFFPWKSRGTTDPD